MHEQQFPFRFRDATPEDRDEALAFTANTWSYGDYIQEVFDFWLADKSGLFVVVEEVDTGRIAAIDKLTFLSPQEAWFEGLRVNPDFRGRGIATRSQRHMIEEARRRGAHTVRFLTLVTNRPIHLMAYRDGFRLRLLLRYWEWSAGSEAPSNVSLEGYSLRPATPAEAPALLHWWARVGGYSTLSLVHRHWQFSSPTLQEWQESAAQGLLLLREGQDVSEVEGPTPLALLREGDRGGWTVGALSAPPGELAPLAAALTATARQAGRQGISGLFPDAWETYNSLQAAGFNPDPDDERLYLFELNVMSDE